MTTPNLTKNIVFYADDDPDDVEFLRECFDQHTQRVELNTFVNGLSLLNHIHRNLSNEIPCLVLLDINMPIMNGKETLHLLRQLPSFETVPVILFTTSSLPSDREFAHRYGAG